MRSAVLSAVLALCAPRATVGGFSNRKSIYTDTVFGSGVSETVGPGEIDFAAVAELMAGNNGTHDINCFTLGAQITRSDGVVVVYEDATPGEQASVAALREAAGCGSTIAVSHFGSQGELVEVFKKGAVVCPGGLIFPIFHGLNMWNPWFHAAIYALSASRRSAPLARRACECVRARVCAHGCWCDGTLTHPTTPPQLRPPSPASNRDHIQF